MRPQTRLWPGAIARLLAFAAAALLAGAVLVLPIAYLAPNAVRSMWFDVASTALVASVAGALILRFVDRRGAGALGIGVSRETSRHIGLGIAIGALALFAAAAGMFAAGALRYGSDDGSSLDWMRIVASDFAFFTIAAYAEEVVFRGYLFQLLVQCIGAPVALLMTSIGFALAHGDNPNVGPFALLNIALAGVMLGIAYLKTLSLWFATAVHMAWNWTMATLLDLPVSGLTMFDTPLYEPTVGGPVWWSGGSFGPEGGVVGTLGFGVALLLLWRWRSVRADARIAAARPLVLAEPEAAVTTEVVSHG